MGCASSSKPANIQVLVSPNTRGVHSSNSDGLGLSSRTVSSTAGLNSSGHDQKQLPSRPPSNASVSTGSVSSPHTGLYRYGWYLCGLCLIYCSTSETRCLLSPNAATLWPAALPGEMSVGSVAELPPLLSWPSPALGEYLVLTRFVVA